MMFIMRLLYMCSGITASEKIGDLTIYQMI